MSGREVGRAPDFEGQKCEGFSHPNDSMDLIWFVAGAFIVLGCLIAFFNLIYVWEIFNYLKLVFLLLMGAMVMIVDAPDILQISFVQDRKEDFAKHCALVFRVTGKGLILTFAGSDLWSFLFTNVEGTTAVCFVGLFSLTVLIVGIGTCCYGMFMSWHLYNAHRSLNNSCVLDDHWGKFALGDVIGKPAFKSLLNQFANGIYFGDQDLTWIFRALSTTGIEHCMKKSDVENWLGSTFTLL